MKCRIAGLCGTLLLLTGCGGGKDAAQTTPAPVPPTTTPESVTAAVVTLSPSPTPTATPEPTPAVTPPPAPTPDPSWLTVDQGHRFGTGTPEAVQMVVYSLTVEADGLRVELAPEPNGANLTAFMTAEDPMPAGEVSFDAEGGALRVVLRNTLLESGDPVTDGGNDDWVFDYIAEQGYVFPVSTAAGAVGEDTDYFENAAVFCDGTDTYLTLVLREGAGVYKVETGGTAALPCFWVRFQ